MLVTGAMFFYFANRVLSTEDVPSSERECVFGFWRSLRMDSRIRDREREIGLVAASNRSFSQKVKVGRRRSNVPEA